MEHHFGHLQGFSNHSSPKDMKNPKSRDTIPLNRNPTNLLGEISDLFTCVFIFY